MRGDTFALRSAARVSRAFRRTTAEQPFQRSTRTRVPSFATRSPPTADQRKQHASFAGENQHVGPNPRSKYLPFCQHDQLGIFPSERRDERVTPSRANSTFRNPSRVMSAKTDRALEEGL